MRGRGVTPHCHGCGHDYQGDLGDHLDAVAHTPEELQRGADVLAAAERHPARLARRVSGAAWRAILFAALLATVIGLGLMHRR